jgi:eukaryotic-like serine/threonine-protein kinase
VTYSFERLLAGRFRLIELRGVGRYGNVYKAEDLTLGSIIAIKILHPSLSEDGQNLADFKDEILILRRLSHPNILRVHEYYQDGEFHFITMDWIEGERLQDKIHQQALTLDSIESYTRQMLLALEYAQEHQIVHRDLKPENILVDHSGRLFIADFGLAKVSQSGTTSYSGSPVYSAPEYLACGSIDNTTDLYSVGVILYQMCCSRLPFSADTWQGLLDEKYQPISYDTKDIQLKKYRQLITMLMSPYQSVRPASAGVANALLQQIDKRRPKPRHIYRYFTFLSIGLLILIGGYSSKFYPPAPTVSYHSLAILPFHVGTGIEHSEWLSHGLPEFLYRELKEHPNIRVLDNSRVTETLALLGYELPLDTAQIKVLSELLQADSVLQASHLAFGPQRHELTIELIKITGSLVMQEKLFQGELQTDAVAETIVKLSDDIAHKLGVSSTGNHTVALSAESLSLLAKSREWVKDAKGEQAKVALTRLLQEHPSYAQAWLELGMLNLAHADVPAAQSAFSMVKKHTTTSALAHKLADAYLYRMAGKSENEKRLYEDLVIEYHYRLDLKFRLSEIYIENDLLAEAENLLRQIVSQDKHHPTAWLELAKIAILSGRMRDAIDEYLVRALIVANRLNDTYIRGDVQNALGVAYQRLGDMDNAISHYNLALQARLQVNNTLGAATSMANLAPLLAIRGEYALAVTHLNTSLTIYQQANDKQGTSDTFNELGVLYEEQGEYHSALEYYRKSLNLRMDLDDDWLKAESLNNVGYIYFLLADPEHAQVYWQQAEQYYRQIDDPVGLLRVKQNQGQLALQKGDWRKAYRLFESTLQQAKQLSLHDERIVASANLAKLAFIQGGFGSALLEIREILTSLKQRQDLRGIIEFSLWAAEWHYLCGDKSSVTALLKEIEDKIAQRGNQEHRLLFNLFSVLTQKNQSGTNLKQRDLLADIRQNTEIPPVVTIKVLLFLAEASLLQENDELNAVMAMLRQQDVTLYPYENIKLLELEAYRALKLQQWNELSQKLDQGMNLLAHLGSYFGRYSFERLQAAWLQHQGLPFASLLAQSEKTENLLQEQCPATGHMGIWQSKQSSASIGNN